MKMKITSLYFLLGGLLTQYSYASGYHFGTQSVTSQSTANAAAAEAADATTIFYNPAGLNYLDKNQVSIAINAVAPYIRYYNAKARYATGEEILYGSREGKITDDVVLAPHVYGAYKINDKLTLGLGMYVPFGSSTQYQADSVLRYNINQLGLKSIAIEPVLAFKPHPQHSIGIGVIAQYSEAKLRKYADWSSGIPSQGLALIGGKRELLTGHAQVKGHDWGVGYHLGWLYDINDRVRVGINYRSKVEHNLKGEANWQADGALAIKQMQAGQLAARGYVAEEGASVKIVTPESLSLHGMFKANDKLNLFADMTYTRHSRFKDVKLKFEHDKVINAKGTRSNQTYIQPNWRNTVKVALGGAYQLNEPMQLRAGVAFDQSPVRRSEERLNTLPDGNRIWFSAGIKYSPNKHHIFDFAYSHIHINDTDFKAKAAIGNDVDSKGVTSARFKNYANIIGAQYTYRF